MKKFFIVNDQNRQYVAQQVAATPAGHVVRVSEPTRTLDQNAALWPLLAEIAAQVVWYGQKLTAEEWKIILTASLKKQKVVPGLDQGTFVMVGESTSKMTKSDFSELLELAHAFAAQQGVKLQVAA
jgi:hypothetical protein